MIKYSGEQAQRIISLVALLTTIPVSDLNTTLATIIALIGCVAQVWGYIAKWRKGDVTILGFKK